MPDYTYLRQSNEPPSLMELRTEFEKLFLSEKENVISRIVEESKRDVEYRVSEFYRNRRSSPQIVKPSLFNKSYRLSDELSIKGVLANGWHYEYCKTVFEPYWVFPSKEEVTSVIEAINKELCGAGIVLSIRYYSGGRHDYNTYITFKINADLGIL